MADWWDNISKSISGMFAPEEPQKPKGLDMELWGPVLEKAGYGKDSPEYLLLDTIGKHSAATPMPSTPSFGKQLLSGALMAGGAGLARVGGATHSEAMQPVYAMTGYMRDRQAGREALLADLHGKLGTVAGSQASSAIATAQARRMAAEMAARQRARMFGTPEEEPAAPPAGPPTSGPIYNTSPPTAAIPPPGTPPGAPPAAAGGAPAPGTPPPGGTPPAGKTAAGGPPGAKFGEPQYPLGPNSPIRFYTKQYRDAAIPIIEAAIAENAAAIASGAKNKEDVLKNEAQKPGSALESLLKADKDAWMSSPEYKAHEQYRSKNMDRSFETAKEIDAAASAARKGNSDLAQFENALLSHIKEGGTTGPLQDWAATIKAWANGIPGVDFDVSRIEEMRKASIGAATKFMRSATVGPTSDREMKTFIDSVTNAGMSTQGNLRLLPFLKLQNDAALEVRQLAGQLMEANNGVLPWDFSERAEAIQQKYQAEAKRLGDALVADYKAGKLGPVAAGSAPAGDKAAAPAAMSEADAKAAARKLMAADPNLSAADAMKQALSQSKAAQPGAAPAQPAAAPAQQPGAPAQQKPSKASEKPPSQASPIGTRKDGWIMSPSGWVPEDQVTRVHTWLWGLGRGGGKPAAAAGPPQPPGSFRPVEPSGAGRYWGRQAEENIRRSTGMGG